MHRVYTRSAAQGGFADFEPDACLVNRYEPGARLSLHQDRNERNLAAPIVSVSLGLPATFLFGGCAAPFGRAASDWKAATLLSGAVLRGWRSMVSSRWLMETTS